MRRRYLLLGLAALFVGAGAPKASTVIGLSVEDQARLSEMVLVGEVIAQRGVRHPINGLETAITLKVTDVLKGDARPNQAILFHTRTGQLEGEISEAMGEAILRTGQTILVFIESVDGRRYNLGLSMGVWDVHEGRSGDRIFTRALQDGLNVVGDGSVEHGPLGYDEMRARVSHAARSPRFDSEALRSRFGQGR